MACDCYMGGINTSTAIFDLSRFNNSYLKSPASTLVNLIFQLPSFSLNQLTCHYTCTAASVYLADVMFILMLRGTVGCLWLQSIENLLYMMLCMCVTL
jgi:hypothetical protein